MLLSKIYCDALNRKVDFSALKSFEYSLKENKAIDVLNGIAFDQINDWYRNIF